MITIADSTYTPNQSHRHRRRSNQSHRHEESEQRSNRLWFLPWVEVVWLLLFALPTLLPGRLLDSGWQPYILLGLLAVWPLHWPWLRQRWSSERMHTMPGVLVLLLCWLPMTVIVAMAPTLSWQSVGYCFLGMSCYVVFSNHPYLQEDPIRLTWSLLLLSGLLVIIAPMLVNWKSEFRLFYIPFYDWFQVIQLGNGGETIHANVLAGALILVGVLLLPQLLSAPQTVHKLHVVDTVEGPKALRIRHPSHAIQRLTTALLSLFFLALLAILLLTQSRGGYLAFGVGWGMVLLLRWPRLWLTVPFLLGGLGYSLYSVGATSVFDLLGADNTFGGADWRGPVWHASWQAFQDFAWTGIGIGNFQQVMPLLYPNPAIANVAATHAHNLLLQIGLDLGLPGLAAYLTFYLTMIGMAVAVLRRTHSPQATAVALGATWDGHALHAPPEVGVTLSTKRFIRQVVHQERTRQQHWAIAAGCLAALIGMQIHGFLDAVTWGNKLAFIPWLIFAQITLLYRYHTEEQEHPEA